MAVFAMVLLLAIICPIVSYPFILRYYHETGDVKISALFAGIASSAFIYGYESDQGNDIVRHMSNLQYYKNLSLMDSIGAGFLPMTYVWDIWQWFIAQLNNEFLMQASGAFVGYSLIAYMIFDYGKLYKHTWRAISTTFIISFLAVSPLSLAIGVRSGNALVFCAFAMYFYFVHGKNWLFTLVLIAMSVFLHHSMVVVLALWFGFIFIRKHPIYGSIFTILILLSFTNYESYISMFMGEQSIFANMGASLQKSAAAYTGERLSSLHHIVYVVLQTSMVVLLFVRGGGRELFITHNSSEIFRKHTTYYHINQFQLYYIVSVFCFLFLLAFNGNRFFLISLVLSFLPFLTTLDINVFLGRNRFWFLDFLMVVILAGTDLLVCYDLNAGTGSLASFFKSGFFGYLSRFLF